MKTTIAIIISIACVTGLFSLCHVDGQKPETTYPVVNEFDGTAKSLLHWRVTETKVGDYGVMHFYYTNRAGDSTRYIMAVGKDIQIDHSYPNLK